MSIGPVACGFSRTVGFFPLRLPVEAFERLRGAPAPSNRALQYARRSVADRIAFTNSSGWVSTIAGSTIEFADGASARFSLPQYVAIASDSSLLISDSAADRVRKIIWKSGSERRHQRHQRGSP